MKKLLYLILALFVVACGTKSQQADSEMSNQQLYDEWLSYRNEVKRTISEDSLLGSWTVNGHHYDPIDNLTITKNGKYSVERVKDYDTPENGNMVRQGYYEFDSVTNILTLYDYHTDIEMKDGYPKNQKLVVELDNDTLMFYEYGAFLTVGIRIK
jgi:lipoprotein